MMSFFCNFFLPCFEQIQQCKSGIFATQTTQSTTNRITQNYAPLDDDFDMGFVNPTPETLDDDDDDDDESDEEIVTSDSHESQQHTIGELYFFLFWLFTNVILKWFVFTQLLYYEQDGTQGQF